MGAEQKLVEFVYQTGYNDLPPSAVKVIKNQLLAVLGTTVAGAYAEGCETVVNMAKKTGGREESSILIHGGRVPSQHAAFVNGVMARALDFCDALAPGAHIGSAAIPAALAAAELAGGVRGTDFLAAVAVGTEVGVRLNLGEPEYDGFDPTGVCVPFAATVAAGKLLGLSQKEMWNALALAFNKCGGSFQANVDGSLAVRVIEGWAAETGVSCARLAKEGITGPRNFLEGVYGYFHLFGRDRVSADTALSGLVTSYKVDRLVFKKYPSCGLTQGSTEVILSLMGDEGFDAADVDRVEIIVPPYTYKLVGHPFQVGSNPKVNAQFSIRYCVANALVRKGSKLAHFEESAIREEEVLKLAEKVEVISDPAMEARGHTPLDMKVTTRDGKEYLRKSEVPPGFPDNPLSEKEHRQRFRECIGFAAKPLTEEKVENLIRAVDRVEEMGDMTTLIALLLPE
ncbi:MAG TPA: MmgE/PrpD family protein [Syntrophorhabdaceae bacterium]